MSGGSHDYTYQKLDVYDDIPKKYKDFKDLLKDVQEMLHSYEWWQSCDTGIEDFEKDLAAFKKKWMGKKYVEGYDKATDDIRHAISEVLKLEGECQKKTSQ